jgi:hypothetical protein
MMKKNKKKKGRGRIKFSPSNDVIQVTMKIKEKVN